jgi:hypothetical protein
METVNTIEFRIMKKISFFVGILICFSGCFGAESEKTALPADFSKSASQPSETSRVQDATKNKTFFGFSPQKTVFLYADTTQQITVQASPWYEPIYTVQVQLVYDPQKISISDVSGAEGIMPVESSFDPDTGTIRFVGTSTEGIFGKNVPLFTFSVSPLHAEAKGESIVRFDIKNTLALLSDVLNTDTTVRDNPPFLVFSLL